MFPRPCKGPLRASKTYIPPHWNSMEVEDGSCLRKAASPGLFADFETQIKWVSKTIYKPPIFPSATPKQHGNEGRIVPSKDSWSWLICWLSNLYRTNFKGQLQASKTYVQLPKLYGSEGRIMPSKGNWSWLICWFWNTYKINFQRPATNVQNVRSAIPKQHGEGRAVPSKGSWPWLICSH